MDLSVSALSATYLQMPAFSQQAVVRGNGSAEARDSSTSSSTRGNERQDTTRVQLSLAARKSSEDEALKAEAKNPGFSFEYQDRHQVMKVHNAKGVLIYQVPSKGQLALIQAAENDAQQSRKISLTA